MKNYPLLILLLIVLASSCTVQKRVHRPGWSIQWKNNKKAVASERSEELVLNEASSPMEAKKNVESSDLSSGITEEIEQQEYEVSFETEEDYTSSPSSTLTDVPTEVDNNDQTPVSSNIIEHSRATSKDVKTTAAKSERDTGAFAFGLIFIILGLIALVVAGILVVTGIDIAAIIFAVFLGLIAILAIPIGIILLISSNSGSSRSKNRETIEREETEEAPATEMSEADKEAEEAKKAKNKKKTGIVLAVMVGLILGVALLL